MTDLSQTAIAKRITLVNTIGSAADGDSLRGQNVSNFPEGALFYNRAAHRLYELRKNLDSLVVADNANFNVVDGVGSSAAAGRFVALNQWASGVLSGGSLVIAGFDLTNSGRFMVGYVLAGGTQGFLHATKTSAASLTVTSSQGADTSTVVVQFLENLGN